MRALISSLLFGSLLLAAPALAQGADADAGDPVSRAEGHSRRGVEFYEQGRYPEAIREMLAAYQAVPDATLLYNVARIYEAMDQSELAVDYFTRFVKADGADPDTVQQALEHMAALRAGPARGEGTLPEGAPPAADGSGTKAGEGATPSSAEPAGQGPPDVPAATPRAATRTAAEAVVSSRLALDRAPLVAAGVTVGAGAVLGVTGIVALVFHGRARDMDRPYDDRVDARETALSLAVAADVALGMTAAAAVTAGVLAIAAKVNQGPVAVVPVGPRGSFGIGLVARIGPTRGPRR